MKKGTSKNRHTKIIHTACNLLAGIVLCADLLLKEYYGILNAHQKKYLHTMLSESKKLEKLIKKLSEN